MAMMLLFGNGVPEDMSEFNTNKIRAECRKLAIKQEWLDDKEVTYDPNDGWKYHKIFTKESTFVDEVIMIQKRRQDLEDCPHLVDLHRFPMPISAIKEGLSFNRAHLEWLEGAYLLNTDRRAMYREAIEETKTLYNIYFTLECAKSNVYLVHDRRLSLKRLKNLLGESYYLNPFPPPAPFWRFRDVDDK